MDKAVELTGSGSELGLIGTVSQGVVNGQPATHVFSVAAGG